MKKSLGLENLVKNAMIACIYAVLTLAIAPFSYGGVQMRISEIIVFLAFYNRKYIPGLVVGCFISNIPSPIGIMDMIFGTISTIIVCMAMNKLTNRYLASLVGAIVTGIIIGLELYLILDLPFVVNALQVFAGEFIVLIVGAFLFGLLEKNIRIMEFINKES
mgnify:CR=1 FL=1